MSARIETGAVETPSYGKGELEFISVAACETPDPLLQDDSGARNRGAGTPQFRKANPANWRAPYIERSVELPWYDASAILSGDLEFCDSRSYQTPRQGDWGTVE
jgi:hypothetical protein